MIYNNLPGIFQGALASESKFSVISIPGEDGDAIVDLLDDPDAEASITLTLEDRPSQNVIAEKSGRGESVVVLGGHFDSVPMIAGANDNASGTAVFLTIARMLEHADLPFTFRIVPFGSEELGLKGSKFYVASLSEEELENTKAMLNFDALGSGSGVSVFGDRDLVDLVTAVGSETGVEITDTRGLSGKSIDFASFQKENIPYLMFYGDNLSRIHSEADTIEFVVPELLGGAAVSAAALLQSPGFADFVNGK